MVDCRALLQTFLGTVERTIQELSQDTTASSVATRQRHAGKLEGNRQVADKCKQVLLAGPVEESHLRALCVTWRGMAIKEFTSSFQGELIERFKSRYHFGMSYAFALAAVELERYLRVLRKKEQEQEGGVA